MQEGIEHYLAKYGALLKQWDDVLAEKNVEKVMISDEELAKFKEVAGQPIHDAWIADMSAQGLPAQELYDLVFSTLDEVRASN